MRDIKKSILEEFIADQTAMDLHPETKLIHLVLRTPDLMDRVALVPEDFGVWSEQWKMILNRYNNQKPFGFVDGNYPSKFQIHHFMLDGEYVSEHDIDTYVSQIRDNSILRHVQASDDIDEIQTILDKRLIGESVSSLNDVASKFYDSYAERQEKISQGYIGVRTGDKWIDTRVVFDECNLITIAGRPGEGKSSYSLNLALQMAHHGSKVCYVGLEMNEIENFQRALAIVTETSLRDLKKYEELHLGVLIDKIDKYTKGNMDFHHPEVCTAAGVDALARNYDVVVVDQLSCMYEPEIRGETKASKYGRITNKLKRTAMKYQNTVVLCAQINRAGAGAPELIHLKDSGSIEEDSDIVLLIHREDKEASLTDVLCAKNRHGEANHKTQYTFDRKYTKFRSLHKPLVPYA